MPDLNHRDPSAGAAGSGALRAHCLTWLLFAAATAAGPCLADGALYPYAGAEVEHDSNIFDLPSSSPQPLGKNGATLADTFVQARAGVDGTYLLDRQKFFGTAEVSHFSYDNFTALDHNQNLLDGGLDWRLEDEVGGRLEYRHEQRMVPFQQLSAATDLIIETENDAIASFNVRITPEWRWETWLRDQGLDSPRTDTPGLSLHQDSIKEGVKYLGVADLAAGIESEYVEGKYNHDPTALDPNFHQISLSAAATYIVSGLSNFNGTLGFTRRSDPTNSGISGLTGSLGYQHSLTAKTTITAQLSRLLNTYVSTGGNEVDTAATVAASWQATYKILVKIGYGFTESRFPDTPSGAVFIDRVDHYQSANVDVTYQILHWLSIRPYARYQTRHSNFEVNSFNNNTIGIEVLAKRPAPKR